MQDILKDKNTIRRDEKASEPDSNKTEMLELLDWEFKITVINMLRGLIEKADNMQELPGRVSREMDTLRKNLLPADKLFLIVSSI